MKVFFLHVFLVTIVVLLNSPITADSEVDTERQEEIVNDAVAEAKKQCEFAFKGEPAADLEACLQRAEQKDTTTLSSDTADEDDATASQGPSDENPEAAATKSPSDSMVATTVRPATLLPNDWVEKCQDSRFYCMYLVNELMNNRDHKAPNSGEDLPRLTPKEEQMMEEFCAQNKTRCNALLAEALLYNAAQVRSGQVGAENKNTSGMFIILGVIIVAAVIAAVLFFIYRKFKRPAEQDGGRKGDNAVDAAKTHKEARSQGKSTKASRAKHRSQAPSKSIKASKIIKSGQAKGKSISSKRKSTAPKQLIKSKKTT